MEVLYLLAGDIMDEATCESCCLMTHGRLERKNRGGSLLLDKKPGGH